METLDPQSKELRSRMFKNFEKPDSRDSFGRTRADILKEHNFEKPELLTFGEDGEWYYDGKKTDFFSEREGEEIKEYTEPKDDPEEFLPENYFEEHKRQINIQEDFTPEEIEPVDNLGRGINEIAQFFKDKYGFVGNKSDIVFDYNKHEWTINGKDPAQWKADLDYLYSKSKKDEYHNN